MLLKELNLSFLNWMKCLIKDQRRMIKRNFEKIKNKKQLKAIEYQGQRQLDMLDEHGRKQL